MGQYSIVVETSGLGAIRPRAQGGNNGPCNLTICTSELMKCQLIANLSALSLKNC